MDQKLTDQIIALIKREVVPAVGCTEPVAVSLAVAKAVRLLGADFNDITAIRCTLSANIIKNAMGVGIPGTGMIGLPIAVALGAICGDPDLGLEVLSKVTDADVTAGKAFISKNIISFTRACTDLGTLYVRVDIDTPGHTAMAEISGSHTNFTRLSVDGSPLPVSIGSAADDNAADDTDTPLTFALVWEFATTTPLDDLRFILETRRLNKAAAEWALMDAYGHRVGRTLHSERQRHVMGDSTFSRILSYTAAACDARMGGAPVAVMSNSGSGNQGIAATMPVVIYAEENYANEEQTIRALILSHLTSIYIKQHLGRLSALCGCVVATTGSSAGICFLMGGNYSQVAATIKNMAANLTGMICDGAKPSCALKLTSGVSTAVISAMMAMEGEEATCMEGIIDADIDRTVANFCAIGRDGMTQTDDLILSIMTAK